MTLAVVHSLVWWRGHKARAHALFALCAAGTGVFALGELWIMQSATPAEYGTAMRWTHVPLWLLMISLVGLVRVYLNAGRKWLAWLVVGSRTLVLVINFFAAVNFNYSQITSVTDMSVLGESVAVAVGPPNSWKLLGPVSSLLLLVFVADATISTLRRGEYRKALTVGGSIVFFVSVATAQAQLAVFGFVQMPVTISLFYVGIMLAMGYELSRDVLQAAQLSEDLRESGERLNLAAEAANLGLWTRNAVKDEIWATEEFRNMYGFRAKDTIGINQILQKLHPDDRDSVRESLSKALATDGRFESEHRIVRPDGQIRWVAARGRVDFHGDSKHRILRGVSLDITERRRSEAETQELRVGMAHGARVTMLGQLASSLAHELSQPLGAILRNAEAAELILKCDSPDLEELRAIVSDIHKDDHRAGDVIDRLRSLLKRHSLDSRLIGVDHLVDEVIALVRSDCAARRVKLSTSVPANLPLVRGDRVHLLQVMLNLIINGMDAVDAEPDAERRVTLRARGDGNGMIEVAVSDCGHGVPTEKLEHVFEPFFTTKPNGMGMGLPISKTIVEAHGGRIWAENNVGRGTTFRFTLIPGESGAVT